MTTKAEAKQLAGELLRLTPIGQALQSQHDTRMAEAYDQVLAELDNYGVNVWASTESMPASVSPHFVALMAHNKMNVYGVSDSLYTRIVNRVGIDGHTGRQTIKGLVNEGYSNIDEPTDY